MNQMGVIFDQFDRFKIERMQSWNMEPEEIMIWIILILSYLLQEIIACLFFVSSAFWSHFCSGSFWVIAAYEDR